MRTPICIPAKRPAPELLARALFQTSVRSGLGRGTGSGQGVLLQAEPRSCPVVLAVLNLRQAEGRSTRHLTVYLTYSRPACIFVVD